MSKIGLFIIICVLTYYKKLYDESLISEPIIVLRNANYKLSIYDNKFVKLEKGEQVSYTII